MVLIDFNEGCCQCCQVFVKNCLSTVQCVFFLRDKTEWIMILNINITYFLWHCLGTFYAV